LYRYLFELTFEFALFPIFNENKFRSRETCQAGVMKKSWVDVADLFVALTISNQPLAGCIIVRASRDFALDGALIVNRPT
jgi:hypothetical protein